MKVPEPTEIGNMRWSNFVQFERTIEIDGMSKPVMTTQRTIVQDVLPGSYALNQIFDFESLVQLKPKLTEICGVEWVSGGTNKDGIMEKGRLLFPPNFDGVVKTEIGTNELVSYYDCKVTNNMKHETLFLKTRSVIQDFTYHDNYLDKYVLSNKYNNGSGLERHDFPHVNCPRDADSGHLVLAKIFNKDQSTLHITAFKIPQKHCILIPNGVIHCNEYLKGTWRTMLSDQLPIDYVYLENRKNGRFYFQFTNT